MDNKLFVDTFQVAVIIFSGHGAVAELADAADSKSADREIVWVQVPSAPPEFEKAFPGVRQVLEPRSGSAELRREMPFLML